MVIAAVALGVYFACCRRKRKDSQVPDIPPPGPVAPGPGMTLREPTVPALDPTYGYTGGPVGWVPAVMEDEKEPEQEFGYRRQSPVHRTYRGMTTGRPGGGRATPLGEWKEIGGYGYNSSSGGGNVSRSSSDLESPPRENYTGVGRSSPELHMWVPVEPVQETREEGDDTAHLTPRASYRDGFTI